MRIPGAAGLGRAWRGKRHQAADRLASGQHTSTSFPLAEWALSGKSRRLTFRSFTLPQCRKAGILRHRVTL
jgi:hypothetical protein